jgi:hypothetical protein
VSCQTYLLVHLAGAAGSCSRAELEAQLESLKAEVERRARAFNAAVEAASQRVQQQAEETQQELQQQLVQVGAHCRGANVVVDGFFGLPSSTMFCCVTCELPTCSGGDVMRFPSGW